MELPDEILLEIYKHCDFETRITLNRIFNWNFKTVNPYYDHKFKPFSSLISLYRSINLFKLKPFPFQPTGDLSANWRQSVNRQMASFQSTVVNSANCHVIVGKTKQRVRVPKRSKKRY